jgi:hypothetical protein
MRKGINREEKGKQKNPNHKNQIKKYKRSKIKIKKLKKDQRNLNSEIKVWIS